MRDDTDKLAVVLDDEHNLTASEMADLKKLVGNYRAARWGVTAVITVGGFFVGIHELWHYISKWSH